MGREKGSGRRKKAGMWELQGWSRQAAKGRTHRIVTSEPPPTAAMGPNAPSPSKGTTWLLDTKPPLLIRVPGVAP